MIGNQTLTITPDGALEVASAASPTITTHERRSLLDTLAGLGAIEDSGLLPPGLLARRHDGTHEQLVVVLPPGRSRLCWGQRERDPHAQWYQVAQPYRVLIGEYYLGHFLGARMFYSPTPIQDLDDVLYHVNVPNVNCFGYNDTAVGWVCLYRHDDTTALNLAGRVAYLALRCSGQEAFNTLNMAETDGVRFYREAGAPEHLWQPEAWEAYSEAEGTGWVTEADTWLAVRVAGLDDQNAHDPDGVPLTLGMAMTGTCRYYYPDGDDGAMRTYNARARGIGLDDATGAALLRRAALGARSWDRRVAEDAPPRRVAPPAGTSVVRPGVTLADVLGSVEPQAHLVAPGHDVEQRRRVVSAMAKAKAKKLLEAADKAADKDLEAADKAPAWVTQPLPVPNAPVELTTMTTALTALSDEGQKAEVTVSAAGFGPYLAECEPGYVCEHIDPDDDVDDPDDESAWCSQPAAYVATNAVASPRYFCVDHLEDHFVRCDTCATWVPWPQAAEFGYPGKWFCPAHAPGGQQL